MGGFAMNPAVLRAAQSLRGIGGWGGVQKPQTPEMGLPGGFVKPQGPMGGVVKSMPPMGGVLRPGAEAVSRDANLMRPGVNLPQSGMMTGGNMAQMRDIAPMIGGVMRGGNMGTAGGNMGAPPMPPPMALGGGETGGWVGGNMGSTGAPAGQAGPSAPQVQRPQPRAARFRGRW